ncbi:MAG: metal-dependent hydrolase [Planctomycetota bacterium]
MKLTWYGHATWALEIGSHKLLIDPFFNDNPACNRSADDVEADFVLLTHGHFDHVADAASIAKRCQSKLIANYEIATWFQANHGIVDPIGMNLGGGVDLPFGRVTMTLAQHSSQLPDGSYGGNPGGFVIEAEGKRIYFAGDTALFSDMKWIASKPIDVAVLPIGDLFTMGPDDSVEAVKLLEPKMVIPAHYNTWPPIEQDAEQWAAQVTRDTEADPKVLQVAESLDI